MGDYNIGEFILYMVALVFSLSLHEAGHAWTSNRFGDDLAHSQGRVSLNPVTHVDPIGTLLFPAIAFFTGAPLLGWARPTPVNPLAWREKRKADIWVSAAGVICNFAVAVITGVALRVLFETGVAQFTQGGFVPTDPDAGMTAGALKLLETFFVMNVGLGVFNLIPIPPLDGSRIIGSLLPESFGSAVEAIEQYGFILLIVALFTGVFRAVFNFVMPIVFYLLFIGRV
ncbi:MAG TPA: site-2 protease family protein [Pyrinomonadaceae bacterium]|nr:site-2 protease family protein [Pyrinomonadaceae bacterium]